VRLSSIEYSNSALVLEILERLGCFPKNWSVQHRNKNNLTQMESHDRISSVVMLLDIMHTTRKVLVYLETFRDKLEILKKTAFFRGADKLFSLVATVNCTLSLLARSLVVVSLLWWPI